MFHNTGPARSKETEEGHSRSVGRPGDVGGRRNGCTNEMHSPARPLPGGWTACRACRAAEGSERHTSPTIVVSDPSSPSTRSSGGKGDAAEVVSKSRMQHRGVEKCREGMCRTAI